jgi:hypothetical protein
MTMALAVMERLVDMMVIQGESEGLGVDHNLIRAMSVNEQLTTRQMVFNLYTDILKTFSKDGMKWNIKPKKAGFFDWIFGDQTDVITLNERKIAQVSVYTAGSDMNFIKVDGNLPPYPVPKHYSMEVSEFSKKKIEKRKDILIYFLAYNHKGLIKQEEISRIYDEHFHTQYKTEPNNARDEYRASDGD